MNFRQLEIFRAVIATGSATAAAHLLGMTQPAVSRSLAQLERDMGLELFSRDKGKLTPTAHATSLSGEVALAFEGLDRVANAAARMRSHQAGTLRVAAPYSTCEMLLPLTLSRLAKSHRDLRFSVEVGSYEAILGMVARREVDVGIVKEPVAHPGVSTIPLAESRAVCALPEGHRLTRSRVISVNTIAGEPLILIGRNAPWRHDIHALFRKAGYQPVIRLETHSVGAACGFVACGMGIAIVPELLAAQFAGRGIVLKPLEADIRHRFAIGYPTGMKRSGLVTAVAKEAQAAARELVRRRREEPR